MAINLAAKYEDKIATVFTKNSFVAGNANKDYSFDGVKTVNIYTPRTVELNDYKREGLMRFGAPVEMQDTVQALTLTQDKSFAITIDRGNNVDQLNIKGAGKMLNLQLKERVVPHMDKYALRKWTEDAGVVAGLAAEPDVDSIVKLIFDGATALDNGLVPDDKRLLYIPSTFYNYLRLSKEFLAVDNMAEKSLTKGLVGMVADMKVIKVPDSYFMDGLYFLITYKGSVLNPNKIKTTRILTDVMGIDGSVLEGRNYFDAYVLEAKAGGVYAAVDKAKTTEAPVISLLADKATVSAVGAETYYTLDGSDPRYSKPDSVKLYTAPVTLAAGQEIRAYTVSDGKFKSPVSVARAV